MRIIAENLGYRELARLADFLSKCTTDSIYYEQINRWFDLGFDYVEIGYDLYYDECYMTNESNMKLYESDFV